MYRQGASDDAPAANRLGVGFLLIWTLCTAISLAIDRWDFTVHADVSTQELTYWTAYAFAYRPLNGFCLAFLLVVLKRLVLRQPRLPTAPGHWYLLSMAVLLAIVRTEDVLRLAASAQADDWLGGFSNYSLPMSVATGLATIAAFAGAIWIREHVWWRLTLISLALDWMLAIAFAWDSNLVQSLVPSGLRLDTVGILLHSMPVAVSLAAMIHDRRSGRRHDFYHWLGIFTLWATTVVSWPSHFWYAAIYG
ncbi:MAG TPA: hypothetical protein VFB96_13955 [Pirellulaceae bacterium]|nr:hypothetical protein [Pirellulaceae bacterium]